MIEPSNLKISDIVKKTLEEVLSEYKNCAEIYNLTCRLTHLILFSQFAEIKKESQRKLNEMYDGEIEVSFIKEERIIKTYITYKGEKNKWVFVAQYKKTEILLKNIIINRISSSIYKFISSQSYHPNQAL